MGWATLGVAIATFVIAVVGIGVAWSELRRTARAAGAEALSLALAPLDAPLIRESRYHVLSDEFPKYPPLLAPWWGSSAELRIRDLLHAYDTVALYVLQELIDETYVIKLHRNSIFKVWEKLEWFVLEERILRRPGYAQYLGELVERWGYPVRPISAGES